MSSDWNTLKEIHDVLEPFAKALTLLEGSCYVDISNVYPVLFALQANLDEVIFVIIDKYSYYYHLIVVLFK